jgi:vacuolar-type H+-ATPase subunit E/Vma4
MALPDIIKKIEDDAAHDASAILEKARGEVKEIESQALAECSALEDTLEKAIETKAMRAREHILAAAHHTAQFLETAHKNTHIEAVFDALNKKLAALSDDEYQKLMASFISEIPLDARFEVAPERERETLSFLKKHDVDGSRVHTAKEGVLGGGFRMITDSLEVDASFAGIIERIRAHQKTRIAKELFTS